MPSNIKIQTDRTASLYLKGPICTNLVTIKPHIIGLFPQLVHLRSEEPRIWNERGVSKTLKIADAAKILLSSGNDVSKGLPEQRKY